LEAVPPDALPWANIGIAQNMSASANNKNFVFIGVLLLQY